MAVPVRYWREWCGGSEQQLNAFDRCLEVLDQVLYLTAKGPFCVLGLRISP